MKIQFLLALAFASASAAPATVEHAVAHEEVLQAMKLRAENTPRRRRRHLKGFQCPPNSQNPNCP